MKEVKDVSTKPAWMFWVKVLMLTTAVTGLEAVYTAETSYAIPTLLRTGLKEKYASIIWAFSPLLGILFQGYLGSASDRCKCSWGRRRPFILGLAICVSVSTILFPCGGIVSRYLGYSKETGVWFVFFYTLITFGVMDFALDQFDPPMRMYLLDSVPLQHSDRANYIYTAMTSLGSFLGALSGAVSWSQDFHYQVVIVFFLNMCLFVACVAMALCSFREECPARLKHKLRTSECEDTVGLHCTTDVPMNMDTLFITTTRTNCLYLCCSYDVPHCPSLLSRGVSQFRYILYNVTGIVRGTVEFVQCMSTATLILWLMVFLDWMVFLCFSIFFSDYIGVVVYGGSPDAQGDPEKLVLYDQGVRSSCWCRVAMDTVTLVYMFVLDWISDWVDHRSILIAGHVTNLVAIVTLIVVPTLYMAVVMSITCALLTANMMSIPFSLIHHYKETDMLLNKPWPYQSDVKGKALSLFGVAMFLAQLILALCMGTIIEWWGSPSVILMVCLLATSLGGLVSCYITVRTKQ